MPLLPYSQRASLDGSHVVFGSVTVGMDVVRAIEKCGSEKGGVTEFVVIADCGEL
jgi:cyclophilin family peptidyl-prolyl cis-trans isomerase